MIDEQISMLGALACEKHKFHNYSMKDDRCFYCGTDWRNTMTSDFSYC